VRWTREILEEAQRNLIANRGDEDRIRRRFQALREHFGDWEITGYDDLISSMRCDAKDRHVLAAAVRSGASQIVTANIRDFPESVIAPYGIEVVSPDDFLLNALYLYPRDTLEVIQEQAAALRRPPLSIENLLSSLSRCGAPQFAEEVETIIAAT
jgi:hypothetical protein